MIAVNVMISGEKKEIRDRLQLVEEEIVVDREEERVVEGDRASN